MHRPEQGGWRSGGDGRSLGRGLLTLVGERSNEWLYRYKLQWSN
jgi:hypothetical protein